MIESFVSFMDSYVSISYMLAVVFGTEILNKYVPFFKKVDSRITAIIVPLAIALVFYLIQSPQEGKAFTEKIFVSFLCAIATYDFLVKPVKKFVQSKLKSLNIEE
jgi:hypothetical protein